MRWVLFLVVAVFLSFSGHAATGQAWGCCVPDTAVDCFDGSIIGYQGSFTANFAPKCLSTMTDRNQTNQELISNHILGYGSAATCAPFRVPGQKCELGCCCKDAITPKTGTQTTRESCSILGAADPNDPRSFKPLEAGKTCEEVCGGVNQPTVPRYTVSGVVVQPNNQTIRNVMVSVDYHNNPQNSVTTDASGAFQLPNPVGGTVRFIAVPTSSTVPTTCRPTTVQQPITGATTLKIVMQCDAVACTNTAPSISGIGVVSGTRNVSFSVTTPDGCGTLMGYTIKRCERQGNVINASTCVFLTPNHQFTDVNVKENTELCYIVNSSFRSGTPITASAQACVTTGSLECMTRSGPWCGGPSTKLRCDQNNKMITEKCPQGQYCSAGQCIATPECQKCNGVGGLFSKLDLSVVVDTLKSCKELASAATEPAAKRCYVDNALAGKPAIVPVYNSCLAVTSCNQYKSKNACESNLCEAKAQDGDIDNCRWVDINTELGLGICTGEIPSCTACNDIAGCNQQTCTAIDKGCYYDDQANGLTNFTARCLAKQDMACRYYDTETDCLGGKPAVYALGTTNQRTPSSDVLGIGACSAWITDGTLSRCIKNADNSPNAREDDCIQNGAFSTNKACVKDSTPPTTNFILRINATYAQHEITSLPFNVVDDMTLPVDIKTYVCFSKTPCYPRQLARAVTVPDVGEYTMYYYSVDKHGNHEQVKSEEITIVDAGYSTLKRVDIVNNG